MTYVPGTILTRTTPYDEPDEGERDLTPYNSVRVVGPSPVQRGARSEEWAGQLGDELTVTPETAFGPTIDLPFGQLQRDYEITFEPDPFAIEPVAAPAPPAEVRRRSPEEQLRTGTATPVVPRPPSEDEREQRSIEERLAALEAAARA
jgi:hypothetical protein